MFSKKIFDQKSRFRFLVLEQLSFLLRGATVTAELTSDHYRSPLIQGGIEIPYKVTAKISGTLTNLLIIDK